MKTLICFSLCLLARAGDFDPAAGQPGSLAISLDNPRIRSWAETVHLYQPGEDVDENWQAPENALGPATGDPFDIVCLGRGGSITFSWAILLINSPGPDLAIFENSFSGRFLELAHVEVSSDGKNWLRFPSISRTSSPVGSFGVVEPTNLNGLAGKYRATFGTGFDFSDLPVDPLVDRNAIRFVRLVDVVGDGTDLDSLGNPIYDPYPTFGSAGFDLDGIAILGPEPMTLLETEFNHQDVGFTWMVEPGKTYSIERSAALEEEGQWTEASRITASGWSLTYRTLRSQKAFLRLREIEADSP